MEYTIDETYLGWIWSLWNDNKIVQESERFFATEKEARDDAQKHANQNSSASDEDAEEKEAEEEHIRYYSSPRALN